MNTPLNTEEIIKSVCGMRVIDLSHTIEEGMPVYPTHPQYFHMKWNTGDPANLYQLLISEHAGTHLDSPCHFYGNVDDPRHIDLEHLPIKSFFGKAVRLDFLGLEGNIQLDPKDIEDWEKAHFDILPEDAVVFHFGWDTKWSKLPEGRDFLKSWPGITGDTAAYLASRGVRIVATDCLGIDGSTTSDLGAHFTLLDKGILIVENLMNLAQLPEVFFLVTLPLKILDGTGSPIRAIGLYRE